MALAEFDSDAMDALKALSIDTGELVPKYHLDMGYPPLNKMLTGSPFRGLTCGRIYEIAGPASSGKTLLATMAMIAAQEQGGIAIMEDWEQAFSADLAAQIGLCVEAPYFIYNRPETWEDGNSHAMKVAKMVRDKKMIPDDAPIVVVFDSIAAATAMSQLYDSKGVRREIDSMGMNDTTALARATSLTLKIINNQIGHYNVVAIYLNQIRTKPGVCLRYDAPVTLADGSQCKIGKIVHDRIPVKVLTVDPETLEVKVKRIEQFHRNPHDGRWVQVVTAGGKNGRRSAFFTPEHQILTTAGWKRADALTLDDRVRTVDLRHYTDEQHQIILGSLLGDGQIRFGDGKSPTSEKARLRMVHGNKQRDYLAWKSRLLGLKPSSTALHTYADSASSHEFGPYRSIEKSKSLKQVPQEWVEKITPLVVAIWYMDDGTYSAKSGGLKYGHGRYSIAAKHLPSEALERIAGRIEAIGLGRATCKEGTGLIFTGADAEKFGAGISGFVPGCMAYKLNRLQLAGGELLTLENMTPTNVVYDNRILTITSTVGEGALDRYKYDIGIPETHTFIAGGGMVVHNCYGDPTTTPGGGAMEYYASTRIFTGMKRTFDGTGSDKELTGTLIGMTTKKNKIAKPLQTTHLRLMYGDDALARFDWTGGYIDELVDSGQLAEKSGRVEWEGKTYFRSQLIKKIDEEGRLQDLKNMYLEPYKH